MSDPRLFHFFRESNCCGFETCIKYDNKKKTNDSFLFALTTENSLNNDGLMKNIASYFPFSVFN